jgi:hypothetical protein
MSANLISQDVVPIGTGYVILMGVLAAGLRVQRRDAIRAREQETAGVAKSPDTDTGSHTGAAAARGDAAGGDAAREGASRGDAARGDAAREVGPGGRTPGAVARRVPAGWPRFAVQACATALAGYVLLMAVDLLYYFGVARVAGQFIESAFTGGLLLIGISLPLFGAASWLYIRWRHR